MLGAVSRSWEYALPLFFFVSFCFWTNLTSAKTKIRIVTQSNPPRILLFSSATTASRLLSVFPAASMWRTLCYRCSRKAIVSPAPRFSWTTNRLSPRLAMFQWTPPTRSFACTSLLSTPTRRSFTPIPSSILAPIPETTSAVRSGPPISPRSATPPSFPPSPPPPSPRVPSSSPIPAGPKCGASRWIDGTRKNARCDRPFEREACFKTSRQSVAGPIRWAWCTLRLLSSSRTRTRPRLFRSAISRPRRTRFLSPRRTRSTTSRSEMSRRSTLRSRQPSCSRLRSAVWTRGFT